MDILVGNSRHLHNVWGRNPHRLQYWRYKCPCCGKISGQILEFWKTSCDLFSTLKNGATRQYTKRME